MEASTLCDLAGPHGNINPGSRSRWNPESPVFCSLEMWTVYNAAWIDYKLHSFSNKSMMYKKVSSALSVPFCFSNVPKMHERINIFDRNIIHKLHLNSSTCWLRLSPSPALVQKLTADWQWGTSSSVLLKSTYSMEKVNVKNVRWYRSDYINIFISI